MNNKTWKYFCNERPAAPGAVPRYGMLEYLPDDRGGKYGAVVYNRELTLSELVEYELTDCRKQV